MFTNYKFAKGRSLENNALKTKCLAIYAKFYDNVRNLFCS